MEGADNIEKLIAHFGEGINLTAYAVDVLNDVGELSYGEALQDEQLKKVIEHLAKKKKAMDVAAQTMAEVNDKLEAEIGQIEKYLSRVPEDSVKAINDATNKITNLQNEITAVRQKYASPGHKIHVLETEIANMDKTKQLTELFDEMLIDMLILMRDMDKAQQLEYILMNHKKASLIPLPLLEYLRNPRTMPTTVMLLTALSESSKSRGTISVDMHRYQSGDEEETPKLIKDFSRIYESLNEFMRRPGAFKRTDDEKDQLLGHKWTSAEYNAIVDSTWLYIEKMTSYLRDNLLKCINTAEPDDPDDLLASMFIPRNAEGNLTDSPQMIFKLRLVSLCFSDSTDMSNKLAGILSKYILRDTEQRVKAMEDIVQTTDEEFSKYIVGIFSQLNVATTNAISLFTDIFKEPLELFKLYLNRLGELLINFMNNFIATINSVTQANKYTNYRFKNSLVRFRLELGSLYSNMTGIKRVSRTNEEIDRAGGVLKMLSEYQFQDSTKTTFLSQMPVKSEYSIMNDLDCVLELEYNTINSLYENLYNKFLALLSETPALQLEDMFTAKIDDQFATLLSVNPNVLLKFLLTPPVVKGNESIRPEYNSIPTMEQIIPFYQENNEERFKGVLKSVLSDTFNSMKMFYQPKLGIEGEAAQQFDEFTINYTTVLKHILSKAMQVFEEGLRFLMALIDMKLAGISNCGYLSEITDNPADFYNMASYIKGMRPGYFPIIAKEGRTFVSKLCETAMNVCLYVIAQINMVKQYFTDVLMPQITTKSVNNIEQIFEFSFIFPLSQQVSLLLQKYCDIVCCCVAYILYTEHTQDIFKQAENGIPSEVPAEYIHQFLEVQMAFISNPLIPQDTVKLIRTSIVNRFANLIILDICRFDISLDGGFHLIPYLNSIGCTVADLFGASDIENLIKSFSSLYISDKDKIKNFLSTKTDVEKRSPISYYWYKLVQDKSGVKVLKAIIKARRDMHKMKDDEFMMFLREIHNASD